MTDFLQYIPPSMLVYVAHIYNRAYNLAVPTIQQFMTTYSAVLTSFQSKTALVFFEDISVPVPFSYTIESARPVQPVQWYFLSDKNLFVDRHSWESFDCESNDKSKYKKLYWLSSEIYNGDKLIGEMSELVETIRFISQDGLPPTPNILISLWSYQAGFVLRRSDTELLVISSEGADYRFKYAWSADQEPAWKMSLVR
jgi:hypothetical protein